MEGLPVIDGKALTLRVPVISQVGPMVAALKGLQLDGFLRKVMAANAAPDDGTQSRAATVVSALNDLLQANPEALGRFVTAFLWNPANRAVLETGTDFEAFHRRLADELDVVDLVNLVRLVQNDKALLESVTSRIAAAAGQAPA